MAREFGGDERRFYFPAALVCAAIVFVGFAPSYYLKGVFHAPPPLSPLSAMHGIVFSAWVVLFVVQTALIGFGNPALHRRLGMLGAVLFGVVLAVGLSTAITAGRLGHAPPGSPPPLAFMVLPIVGIAGAAMLVILALANRARRDFHMRLMLAGMILMLPPALHRIVIGAGFTQASTWTALLATDALLALVIAYDTVAHKRVHPAYLWSAAVFVITDLAVAWGYSSPHWMGAATWLTRGG